MRHKTIIGMLYENMHDASSLFRFVFFLFFCISSSVVFVFLSVIAACMMCFFLYTLVALPSSASLYSIIMGQCKYDRTRACSLFFWVFFFVLSFFPFWWFEFLWLLLVWRGVCCVWVCVRVLRRCLCIRWCILVINQMENSLKLSHCTKWPLRRLRSLCINIRRMWNYLL